jgi:hypothetical protein
MKKFVRIEDQTFEDFAINYTNGIAYTAGDDRTWWERFQLSNEKEKKTRESIYVRFSIGIIGEIEFS